MKNTFMLKECHKDYWQHCRLSNYYYFLIPNENIINIAVESKVNYNAKLMIFIIK